LLYISFCCVLILVNFHSSRQWTKWAVDLEQRRS